MAEEKLNLAAKIAKISAELKAMKKGGHNSQQHYNFIEYAAVAAEIRKKQFEVGIAIVPRIEGYSCDQVATSKGGSGFHYVLDMLFEVINTDNPEDRFQVKWLGEATDYGDKGINKAITSAVKYFIMRLYNISEKGEGDDEFANEADENSPRADLINPQRKSSGSFKVDFGKIREDVPRLDTVEELESYWKSLGDVSVAQSKFLQPIFARRKKELTEAQNG